MRQRILPHKVGGGFDHGTVDEFRNPANHLPLEFGSSNPIIFTGFYIFTSKRW